MSCCGTNSLCCEDKKINHMREIIGKIDLPDTYKLFLKYRYLEELDNFRKESKNTKIFANLFKFIIAFGTLVTPLILSVQNLDESLRDIIYWTVLGISALTTICNIISEVFQFREHYFMYRMALETLRAEGWEYFQLTGTYKNFENHSEAYETFAGQVEKVQKKTMQQFFKLMKSTRKERNKANPSNSVLLLKGAKLIQNEQQNKNPVEQYSNLINQNQNQN